MGDNQKRAAELEQGRKVPPPAEKKKISPKSPGRDLGDDQQRFVSFQSEHITKYGYEHGIRREKADVGDFHHLVIDRRHNRLVAAIDDVHEPVAVVLVEGAILLKN